MLEPLRKGVKSFLNALERTDWDNEEMLLRQKDLRRLLGDNVSVNVYGNVQFLGMDCPQKLGGSVVISFAQPVQIQNAPQRRRYEFWDRSRRRLMQGALVCITSRPHATHMVEQGYVEAPPNFQMVLGVITKRDTMALSKDENVAHLQISLADPKMYLTMLNSMSYMAHSEKHEQWFLIESTGGFFESYRSILQALQNCEPAILPFGKYLAPTRVEEKAKCEAVGNRVDPPLYARAPGFKFDLSVLVKGHELCLDINDLKSIEEAVEALQNQSTLDDSQASALVETICRLVDLISG
jgi:hypothetical protein